MSDDLIRSSDLTDAMRKMSAADKKINALTQDIAGWKLEVLSEVQKNDQGFWVKLTFRKPDGHGFIELIDPQEVAYYVADPEALVQQMVERIFENLYKQQIRDTIAESVTKGLRNANLMASKH